jgi:DHA2 family multidrug resistance protein
MLRSERRSAAPAPATAPDSVVEYGARRVLIVTGVMLAALLQTLDATIVNVALPTIEGNIGAAIDDGTWIITGYIISNVIAIPLAPYFLQRLGRRQYFALCIIGFTVASFLCGTATSLGALVAYRVVQGAFGGGLVATSQIILRDTFEPKEIGASSALFAIALTVGPALGPTLGGILTDAFSWQWVFDINLVPGIAAAIIILTNLRNPLPPRALPFDGIGVALLALGLGSLQYVLDEGERHDWFDDRTIVTFAVLCVAGLTAFVLWELFGTPKPIVDLRIFRYRNVRFGVPVAIVLGMVIFGPVVILPQYVQNVLGFTATLSGLLILMRALPVLLLTPLVARLATRLDVRQLLTAGFLLSSLSFVLLSARMTTTSDFTTFIAVLVISGAAQAMLLVPLLVSIIGSVAPADAPKSSSFVSLSVQLGGSIASTMLVTIFDRRTFFHSEIYRSSATFANAAVVHLLTLPHGRALLARIIALQASNSGFADSIAALIPAALVTLLPIWCLRVAARKPAVAIPIAK